MKNISKIINTLLLLMALSAGNTLYAEKSKDVAKPQTSGAKADAICLPPSNSNELTVNNVRAYIKTNGTMWFKEKAEYEIPRGSGKTSMFSASLWIGGKDVNGQIRVAAMRFAQRGNDFWTGPLDTRSATIDQLTCNQYDKLYKITRAEVEAHIAAFPPGGNPDPSYVMPASIRNWPGNGDWENKGQSHNLAPYFDKDENGQYNPENGDYPYYDIDNSLCPWTDANRAAAAAGTLPKPAEELDPRVSTHGMIFADHVLKGDETLFWIFNDMGGAHTESSSDLQIGLEIRGQVFGFATNDEINNMTFYSYEIINRSTQDLTNTFFSQWVDPDLGYAQDDYVGCDVVRGLGYCYNGTNVDGSGQIEAYGSQPPAVGVDFFQGPYIDPDGVDNAKFYKDSAGSSGYCDRFLNGTHLADEFAINGVNFGDTIIDNERFGMRRFVYHNNDNSVTGDPTIAKDYYNMLQGIWRDNTHMRYGGNAHSLNGGTGPECDFMFPGLTDLCNWGTHGDIPTTVFPGGNGWTEMAVGNAPADRRFMQSAGPFTLRSGAVNYITVGIPWARASQGGAWASVELLKKADDACQALFENCFKVLDGPDAPDVTARELENKVVLYLTNDRPTSNNYNEIYEEVDPQIPHTFTTIERIPHADTVYSMHIDSTSVPFDTTYVPRIISWTEEETHNTDLSDADRSYVFEGYMIYQLKDKSVSVTDLEDLNKARLVAQCDIKNKFSQLINWVYNDQIQTSVAKEMVSGSNTGLFHSVEISEDAFATGSNKLVNHKTYYYLTIAYAVNDYSHFSINPENENGLMGQKKVFLGGRKNIKSIAVIPHKPQPQEGGMILNSDYGTQPMITRIEGQGNGGFFLDLTDDIRDKIVRGGELDQWQNPTYSVQNLQYKNNAGPLAIKVIDPVNVQPFDYVIKFVDSVAVATNGDINDKSATWILQVLDVTKEKAKEIFGEAWDEKLWVNDTLTIFANMAITMQNEQLILPLGISVSITNYPFQIYQDEVSEYLAWNGGDTYRNKFIFSQVDFVGASVSYADESNRWLSGLPDGSGDYPNNWVRSGQQQFGRWEWNSANTGGASNDYSKWKTEDAHFPFNYVDPNRGSAEYSRAFKDPKAQFNGILGGTWAPYPLTSPFHGGPQAKYIKPDNMATEPTPAYYQFCFPNGPTGLSRTIGYSSTMTNVYSVDIVFTNNKDLWSRCVVLEACDDATRSIGGAKAHEPRKQASVDKEGKPDNSGTQGMGWFPGYAVNIETGERLNVMFAENSSDSKNNGTDMIFNPTDVQAYYRTTYDGHDTTLAISYDTYNSLADMGLSYPDIEIINGGKHYLYVLGSSGNTAAIPYDRLASNVNRNFNDDGRIRHPSDGDCGGGIGTNYLPYYDCGAYDECRWVMEKFNTFINISGTPYGLTLAKKMQLFNNVMWASIPMPAFRQVPNWKDYSGAGNDAIVKLRVSRPYMRYASRWYENPSDAPYSDQNHGLPMYSFTTKNIAPSTNDPSTHASILDEINIVPNPYYGSSLYETTAVETYVKIVNLPEVCTISIYTVSGILVKKLSKGDKGSTNVIWDLKNGSNIPVSSGVYMIFVEAPGIGTRTLKFFCAMRPTDLNTF